MRAEGLGSHVSGGWGGGGKFWGECEEGGWGCTKIKVENPSRRITYLHDGRETPPPVWREFDLC